MKRRIRNQTPYQTKKRAIDSYSRFNSPSPLYTRRSPKSTRTNNDSYYQDFITDVSRSKAKKCENCRTSFSGDQDDIDT